MIYRNLSRNTKLCEKIIKMGEFLEVTPIGAETKNHQSDIYFRTAHIQFYICKSFGKWRIDYTRNMKIKQRAKMEVIDDINTQKELLEIIQELIKMRVKVFTVITAKEDYTNYEEVMSRNMTEIKRVLKSMPDLDYSMGQFWHYRDLVTGEVKGIKGDFVVRNYSDDQREELSIKLNQAHIQDLCFEEFKIAA